ncbi:hypothetical protein [Fodinicola feengrottensis]|uniref:hypothetical protein n=1 Tax=Fodinicola feengrottensis TaxID=435914 RepID=UPI0024422B80|nr:hypothetical protein [Fodinicola feengrottensis]
MIAPVLYGRPLPAYEGGAAVDPLAQLVLAEVPSVTAKVPPLVSAAVGAYALFQAVPFQDALWT